VVVQVTKKYLELFSLVQSFFFLTLVPLAQQHVAQQQPQHGLLV